MNVLYYYTNIDRSWGGIYQYSTALLKIFAKDNQNMYFIYCTKYNKEIEEIVKNTDNLKLIYSSSFKLNRNARYLNFFKKKVNDLLGKLSFTSIFFVNSPLELAIKSYNINKLYCPYDDLPNCSVPGITTIHDLQELHYPNYFSQADRIKRDRIKGNAMKKSKHIVTSYNHVKNDIIKFYNVPESKVHVCLLAMNNLWFNSISDKEKAKIFELQNIATGKPFIFYPAATWEHKNHQLIIKALAILKNEKNIIIDFISTGSLTPYFKSVLKPMIAEYGLENQINFKGIVSDQELFLLYQQASAVVIPTLYEAGSFPLMESILLNRPVICSNVTSLPETIGDEKFVFDPNNEMKLAEMIGKILLNEDYRNKNFEARNTAAHRLVNTNCLEVIQNLINSK